MSTAGAVAELPTARDERWRYTPVDEITARAGQSTAATELHTPSLPPSMIDALGATSPRLVFINGFHAPELSDVGRLADGVRCSASDLDPDGRADRSSAGRVVAVVAAAAGVRCDTPIHVVHVSLPDPVTGGSVLSRPRTVIDVGDAARLVVVETYAGLRGATSSEPTTTLHAGEHAELVHHRIQLEALEATHVGLTRIDQGTGSVVRHTSVTLGGDIARNEVEVHLDAPDARTELEGIDIARGRQRHDTVVTVDHGASRCTSSQRFAGVAGDHGRSSFGGEIVVRPGTAATDARQSSRNLVLDRDAGADARPWLRILADDVRCTHGATVGRLDDDALHYLRSRGIPLPHARAMLVDAFVGEIVDTIGDESVRAHVAGLVAAANARPWTSSAPLPAAPAEEGSR